MPMEPARTPPSEGFEDFDYFTALAWANKTREQLGHEPIDHLPPFDGCRCPLLIAIPGAIRVGRTELWRHAYDRHVLHKLPPDVQSFVRKVDQGVYPQLNRRPGECTAKVHHVKCPDGAWGRKQSARRVA